MPIRHPDMNLRQPIIIYQYRISALFWRNKEVFQMAIESPRLPKPPIQPNAIRCTLYAVLNMQNKPNFQNAKMNVNIYYKKAYNNETAFRRRKNKPNSNPVLSAVEWANFFKAQNELKITCRKIRPHPLLLLVRFEVAIMGILQ